MRLSSVTAMSFQVPPPALPLVRHPAAAFVVGVARTRRRSPGGPAVAGVARATSVATLVTLLVATTVGQRALLAPAPAQAHGSETRSPTGQALPPNGSDEAPRRGPADRGLARKLDALLADEPGIYGVVVAGPDGQTRYSRNSEVPFVAASLYKLVVMAAVYDQGAAGALTLDEALFVEVAGWLTIDQALFEMIAYSSNEAALALLARVGGVPVVNQTAADLGLARTQVLADVSAISDAPPRPATDSTTGSIDDAVRFVQGSAPEGLVDLTTPEDIAAFFSLLLDGQVVSETASVAMLDLLKQQAVVDRIPALLPDGIEVAHKTGNLPQVVHDAGVIYTDTGPVIVAVLSEAMPDEARAASLVQQAALLVYEDQVAPPPHPHDPKNQPPQPTPQTESG